MEGGHHVTRVSIDCVPQDDEALRHNLGSPEVDAAGSVESGDPGPLMVPVTFMRKGALRLFDMRGPNGEALPIVGRSEYRALLVGVVLHELRDAVLDASGEELVELLGRIVDGDVDEAGKIALGLVNTGCHEGVQYLDRDGLNDDVNDLLVRLAESYVLIVLLPSQFANQRVVLKYSHHSTAHPDGSLGTRLRRKGGS